MRSKATDLVHRQTAGASFGDDPSGFGRRDDRAFCASVSGQGAGPGEGEGAFLRAAGPPLSVLVRGANAVVRSGRLPSGVPNG